MTSGGPEFASIALDEFHHLTEGFDCGEPVLNSWLVDYAVHAGKMDTARTFVWTTLEGRQVVAYYAICAHILRRDQAPGKVARGSPEAIPAVLLAKLALAIESQRCGLGGELLFDALRRIVMANQQGPAARAVVVDALHESAASFYANYGFRRIANEPLRLVQKMSDITKAVLA